MKHEDGPLFIKSQFMLYQICLIAKPILILDSLVLTYPKVNGNSNPVGGQNEVLTEANKNV